MPNPIRSVTGLFTFLTVCSALAQAPVPVNDSAPIISKRCLWNADKATWSKLGLKREQVRRMEEIKEHYPAVVDGQWIADDVGDLERKVNMDTTATAGSVVPVDGMVALSVEHLQRELRAVLMPDQLNELGALCGERAQH